MGVLVADHQAQSLAELETRQQLFHVADELVQADAFFVQVDAFRAGGQAAHHGQIAALAAHHFDDVTAALRDGGLLDLVHRFDDLVQRRVRANAQIRAGQVVVDRGGQADDRDVEGRIVFALEEQVMTA